jgi:glycosyltransferase involved in cell wall biosynthesis
MKLAVLGIIGGYLPAYSISTVVRNQLLGLQDLGLNPVFINTEGGEHPKEFTGERRYLPNLKMEDWLGGTPLDEHWYDNAQLLVEPMIQALKDIDVLLANDLIMQSWYMQYRWALWVALEHLPNIKVYHLIHSAPADHKDLGAPFNTMYELKEQESVIYNNCSDLQAVAERYQTDRVFGAFNPIDLPDFFELSPEVSSLYKAMRLEDADIITIYPTRLSEGKQIDVWLSMVAAFKELGISIRGIIVNSFSNSQESLDTIARLKDHAADEGLVCNKDFCFTSEVCKSELGLGRHDVSSLNRLANLFIQTSLSETCSLIMLEAMANRQLLILNADLPCNKFQEFGGQEVIYARFGNLHASCFMKGELAHTYYRHIAMEAMEALLSSREQRGFWRALRNHSRRAYAQKLGEIMGVYHNEDIKPLRAVDAPFVGQSIPQEPKVQLSTSGTVPLHLVEKGMY